MLFYFYLTAVENLEGSGGTIISRYDSAPISNFDIEGGSVINNYPNHLTLPYILYFLNKAMHVFESHRLFFPFTTKSPNFWDLMTWLEVTRIQRTVTVTNGSH